MSDDEILQEAEPWKDIVPDEYRFLPQELLTFARRIIAKAQGEPVAWMREWEGDVSDEGNMLFAYGEEEKDDNPNWIPLYKNAAATQSTNQGMPDVQTCTGLSDASAAAPLYQPCPYYSQDRLDPVDGLYKSAYAWLYAYKHCLCKGTGQIAAAPNGGQLPTQSDSRSPAGEHLDAAAPTPSRIEQQAQELEAMALRDVPLRAKNAMNAAASDLRQLERELATLRELAIGLKRTRGSIAFSHALEAMDNYLRETEGKREYATACADLQDAIRAAFPEIDEARKEGK